ncbi:lytic transglycosylase domain-containing protein [Allokutzneria sp. A3M-2-11 16]|uniref:lytic transglycosylase domain-containing protein n=1 Tax=Allokutzneria sp. A3M-2-11 16 TaxID=2962043 RepID=UPI0020B8B9E8|nr:lytic murein transglycosylase [Allokutzneria sp. A3M-2-11 16]MCP3805228.1 lytic transglycosylase domain-containing protein [Allokutzneria sp. A3M-2-11 16]
MPLAFGSARSHQAPEPSRPVSEAYALLGTLRDLSTPDSDDVSQQLVDALRTGPDLTETATATALWEDAPYDPARDIGYGIPGPVLDAYLRADRALAKTMPKCGLHWSYLAGIGKVESNHARGRVDAHGTTPTPILGPVLAGGPGMAAIADTDGGRLDGDPVWDRAVGPMQFIPGTWARYGVDGNSDGVVDPHNIYDAALSAGRYLCSGGLDLREPDQLVTAVFRYNHSNAYVSKVLGLAVGYSLGIAPLPDLPPLVQRVRPAAPAPAPAPTTTSAPPAPLPPCPVPATSGPRRPTTTTPTSTTTPAPTTTSAPCTPVTSTTTPSPSPSPTTSTGPIRRPPLPSRTTTPIPPTTSPTPSSSPVRGSMPSTASRSGTVPPGAP